MHRCLLQGGCGIAGQNACHGGGGLEHDLYTCGASLSLHGRRPLRCVECRCEARFPVACCNARQVTLIWDEVHEAQVA